MWEFNQKFWGNKNLFFGRGNRTWAEYRKDLRDNILGMGLAKTSFVLEMTYPLDSEVVCLDTHMLQLFGCKQGKLTESKYVKYERLWVTESLKRGIPPVISRAIFWDKNQGKFDSSYWAHVFLGEEKLKRVQHA